MAEGTAIPCVACRQAVCRLAVPLALWGSGSLPPPRRAEDPPNPPGPEATGTSYYTHLQIKCALSSEGVCGVDVLRHTAVKLSSLHVSIAKVSVARLISTGARAARTIAHEEEASSFPPDAPPQWDSLVIVFSFFSTYSNSRHVMVFAIVVVTPWWESR